MGNRQKEEKTMPRLKDFNKIKKEWLRYPEVRKEYKAQNEKFTVHA